MFKRSDMYTWGVPGRGVAISEPFQGTNPSPFTTPQARGVAIAEPYGGFGYAQIIAAGITAALQTGTTIYATQMQHKMATEARREERAEMQAQREHEIKMMQQRQSALASKLLQTTSAEAAGTAVQPAGIKAAGTTGVMPTGTGAAAPTTEDGIPKWALPVGIGVAVLLLGGGIFFAARKKRK
jgi:hypothetical protein